MPACYTAFLTEIGNGGCSSSGSAAGPFYGIYPFGKMLAEFTDDFRTSFRLPVAIHPGMTDAHWAGLIHRLEADENLSDVEYEQELGKIYAGILPLGSQGCAYVHGLLLNGPQKGRVVNLDLDLRKPRFAYEAHFLDWYERWLDEIVSGDLLAKNAGWFGYTMGGTDQELIGRYLDSPDVSYKRECLSGLIHKAALSPETLDAVERECVNQEPGLRLMALQLLTKNDYARAEPLLRRAFRATPLQVFQYVYWYARESSEEWIAEIRYILDQRSIDIELYRITTYIITHCRTDLSGLLKPFLEYGNEKIRQHTRYILEKLGVTS